MPGNWDGYDHLDEGTSKELYGKVGYIHALSAEAGRQIIEVGKTLLEMKELLPHGQFMSCVKAEFGWTAAWAGQLMHVAEHFSNLNSSLNLPFGFCIGCIDSPLLVQRHSLIVPVFELSVLTG